MQIAPKQISCQKMTDWIYIAQQEILTLEPNFATMFCKFLTKTSRFEIGSMSFMTNCQSMTGALTT